MQLKEGFIKREVAGKTVIVPTGEASKDFKGVIKLNAQATEIWDAVSEGKTEEQIVEEFVSKYEVSKEQAAEDVHMVFEQMKAAGVFKC